MIYNDILLSIITINRNNANGLRKTIESVIAQTYTNIEYIVVDGNSSDDSINIIESYSQRLAYWISEPDCGIYNAMNKGIERANGDYVIFMNSGDVFANEWVVEKVSDSLGDVDIVCGYVNVNGEFNIYPPDQLSFRFLYSQNIPHQAEFIKKELFDKYGKYSEDLRILSDFEFNIKMSLQDCSYKVLNVCVATVECGGLSMTESDRINEEAALIFDRMFSVSVWKDYQYFLNKKTFSHPAIKWLISKDYLFKTIKALYFMSHKMFRIG